MDSDKRSEVKSFLLSVKNATQSWIILTREKNKNTQIQLGLTDGDVKDEILALSVKDYCQGPCKDRKIEGNVWVFGKVIRGEEVYIKLKLWGDEAGQGVRILSFHFPEAPMSYPFK